LEKLGIVGCQSLKSECSIVITVEAKIGDTYLGALMIRHTLIARLRCDMHVHTLIFQEDVDVMPE
jgi:hypothetical protein